VASAGSTRPSPAAQRTGSSKKLPDVPSAPGEARVIAIANQKGGVGKSTTAVSLGAALAELGFRVLVVDLDPQGNASTGLGIRHEAREITVYDVIVAEAPLDDAVVPTPLPNLSALPSTIDLAGAEIELVSQFSRESRLKKALEPVRTGAYDYVILDCPPSLGLLTINALTAAEELIVPIQCEYYALEGLGQLLRNVNLVQQNINPGLRVTGIVLTMFDPRTKLSEQVVEEVRKFFGDLVYDVIIPRTVRLSEAPGYGQPITVYDPRSKGAESYRELAREVAVRPAPSGPLPVYDEMPTVVVPPVDPTAASPAGAEPELADEPDAVATAEQAETAEPPAEAAAADASAADASAEQNEPQPEPPAGPAPAPPPPEADAGSSAAAPSTEAPSVPVPPSEPPVVDAPPPASAPTPAEPPVVDAPPPASAPTPAEPPVVDAPPPASAPTPAEPLAPPPTSRVTQDEDIWEEAERAPEAKVRAPRGSVEPGHLPERRVVVIDEQAEAELTTTPTPVPPPAHAEPAEAPDLASGAIGATLADEPPPRKRRWRLFRKGGE